MIGPPDAFEDGGNGRAVLWDPGWDANGAPLQPDEFAGPGLDCHGWIVEVRGGVGCLGPGTFTATACKGGNMIRATAADRSMAVAMIRDMIDKRSRRSGRAEKDGSDGIRRPGAPMARQRSGAPFPGRTFPIPTENIDA